jgi:hypothetical protein
MGGDVDCGRHCDVLFGGGKRCSIWDVKVEDDAVYSMHRRGQQEVYEVCDNGGGTLYLKCGLHVTSQ